MDLYELDILEARRIADLADDLRRVRDALIEKVPDTGLGEPDPARGEHNPAGEVSLEPVLETKPEFVTLRDAYAGLPRDIRDKIHAVMMIGRGNGAINDWEDVLAATAAMTEDALLTEIMADPDLHHHVRKGLYMLGAATVPGDRM